MKGSDMGRKPKEAAPAAAAPAATMTPAEYLASIDREQLEADLAAAQHELAEAQGKIRALNSLKKMIDWRDGKRAWTVGGGRRKKGKGQAAPADEPASDDREAILVDLGRHGPSSTLEIATRIQLPMPRVKEALQQALAADDLILEDGHYRIAEE